MKKWISMLCLFPASDDENSESSGVSFVRALVSRQKLSRMPVQSRCSHKSRGRLKLRRETDRSASAAAPPRSPLARRSLVRPQPACSWEQEGWLQLAGC